MKLKFLILLFTAVISVLAETGSENVKKRYEYKMSFKKPYYFLNDNKTIPYFETTDSILHGEHLIRLTSSLPNQSGGIWTSQPNKFKEWQVEFSMFIFGRGSIGDDGFAFWYKRDKMIQGPAYGSDSKFTGLGIIFDSSEPIENRVTPLIYGILNDGTKEILGDGALNRVSSASCFRDYRNSPGPVWVRVTYVEGKVIVDMDLRQNGHAYSHCFTVSGVELPVGYYFGVTASTGQHVADDHDILEFKGYEVNPPPKKVDHATHHLSDAEKEKIKQVEHNIESIVHPEEESAPLESFNPHVVNQILENQFKIIEDLNILFSKLDGAKTPAAVFHAKPAENTQYDSQQFQELNKNFGILVGEVQNLAHAIRELKNNPNSGTADHAINRIESNINALHEKIDSTHRTAADAAQFGRENLLHKQKTKHNMMFYVLACMGGMGLMYAATVIKRINKREKKFI